MQKLLALELDATQVRAVVARTRGKEVLVEQAFTVELADTAGDSPASQGERLASALAARNVGRGETLVALGRTSIELRQMQLPPCPPEELPDLVRFQAMRQFSNINEDWPLDYIPLEQTDEATQVLAAAVAPQLVEQLRTTCDDADLSMKRLVLRPFAAASLLGRHRGADSGCVVMIDVLGEEADLTVLLDAAVVFTRTIRLPGAAHEGTAQTNALLGELRRTIAASRNQMQNRPIDQVVICGTEANHEELIAAIRSKLEYDVVTLDPFEQVTLDRELQQAMPANPGRYAPLIGMLCDEAAGIAHTVDFLHPRKAPPPANHHRTMLIGAATVGVILLVAGIAAMLQLRSFDNQIAQLSADLQTQEETLEALNATLGNIESIEQFAEGDVVWLDELYRTSRQFLPPEQAQLTNLTGSVAADNQGRLILEGYMSESTLLKDLENRLRDSAHQVVGRGTDYTPNRERLPWRFNETVLIQPGGSDEAELAEPATDNPPDQENSPAEGGEPAAGEPPVSNSEDTAPTGDPPLETSAAASRS